MKKDINELFNNLRLSKSKEKELILKEIIEFAHTNKTNYKRVIAELQDSKNKNAFAKVKNILDMKIGSGRFSNTTDIALISKRTIDRANASALKLSKSSDRASASARARARARASASARVSNLFKGNRVGPGPPDPDTPENIIENTVGQMVLSINNAQAQVDGCNKLNNLIINSDNDFEIRKNVVDAGGIYVVITAMKKHINNVNVQQSGCRALYRMAWFISEPEEYAYTTYIILHLGGREAILHAMENFKDDTLMQFEGCKTLGIISYIGADINSIKAVIAAMNNHPGDANIQEYGCVALGPMSSNSGNSAKSEEELDNDILNQQEKVMEEGGIKSILKAMKAFQNNENIQYSGMGSLIAIANNNESAKKEIQKNNGITTILTAMEKHLKNNRIQYIGFNILLTLGYINGSILNEIIKKKGINAIINGMNNNKDDNEYDMMVQLEGIDVLYYLANGNLEGNTYNVIEEIKNAGGVEAVQYVIDKYRDTPNLDDIISGVTGKGIELAQALGIVQVPKPPIGTSTGKIKTRKYRTGRPPTEEADARWKNKGPPVYIKGITNIHKKGPNIYIKGINAGGTES